MPKMKSHSGAKKRFGMTATGKVKFKHAKMRHILEKRPKGMKRKARGTGIMFEADADKVRALLPYGN
jgi:large subunit ribosomal protein L35